MSTPETLCPAPALSAPALPAHAWHLGQNVSSSLCLSESIMQFCPFSSHQVAHVNQDSIGPCQPTQSLCATLTALHTAARRTSQLPGQELSLTGADWAHTSASREKRLHSISSAAMG